MVKITFPESLGSSGELPEPGFCGERCTVSLRCIVLDWEGSDSVADGSEGCGTSCGESGLEVGVGEFGFGT